MNRSAVGLVSVALLLGCQDTSRSGGRMSGPSYAISEARFGGGNPDFFFASPLAATPQPGDANFDVGGSNGALVPYLRICETDGVNSPAGCVTDVTAAVTGLANGLAMTYSASAELYQVNWSTSALNTAKDYRIEIWGTVFSTAAQKAALDPRWLFGWRDIRNSPSVASCNGTEAFCLENYGKTIPVKVRIEQFVFCPVTRNCAVQFVAAGIDANLQAKLDPNTGTPAVQLFIPGQSGTNFAIALEPCTVQEDAAVTNAIDLPTFGPCLRTTTTFTASLSQPGIISACSKLDGSTFDVVDPATQLEQIALHHISDDLSRVEALPEAWSCGTPTSGSLASAAPPNSLLRFVQAVRGKVSTWLAPQPLAAAMRRRRIDQGGGGQVSEFGSFFKFALPAKFEYEFPGDASQTGVAGSSRILRAKVTDLNGRAVKGARVYWTAVTPPGEGATVLGAAPPGPIYTDATGIAQNTVQLSSSQGFNVFHAYGRGIADARENGCTIPPSTPASCNGPRSSFDPFLSQRNPDVFDGTPVNPGSPVDIAEGTRLPFTVFGCTPGLGTATIDGNFTSAEWACAQQYNFTANVSGGATPATLYLMNDGTNLYLAVRLLRSGADKVNTLQFNFDNNDSWKTNGTGAAETGDDVLSLDAVSGFKDAFLTLKCINSSQSSCWATDASAGGTTDGSGAFKNDGTYTTYEIAHPLDTADNAHDFSLSAGAKVGLFLTLQTGSGATGNTQWPGFRKYLEIQIAP